MICPVTGFDCLTCDTRCEIDHPTWGGPDVIHHATRSCADDDHDFQGWRDFEDGSGGEKVCTRCGMGAMAWSMRVGP